MTSTAVTVARSWFRLDRHDVRSTLPPQIIAVMQDGMLDRTFQDALLPNFLFPAIADNSPWSGGMGDTRTFTRTGLIPPNPVPITGSDPTAKTYGVEQWSVTMDQYGDSIDTNLLQSAMTLASLYLRDVQTLGINSGQTLNRVARNKLFAAYAGGRTWATSAGTSDTTIEVASIDGFTHNLVNGVPTPVSGSNPLGVTIEGVANTVVGVNAGASTLTLGTARVDVVGDSVVADTAPFSVRGGTTNDTAFDLSAGDVATFALFRAAVTRLRLMNVPTVGGYYIAHIDPETENQLFDDADFKNALQSRVDSPIYQNLSIGRFAGIDWVRNNETPILASGTDGLTATVHRALVLGDGALIGAPFSEMGTLLGGTGVEDVPSIRMIGPASGVSVAVIVRPPQDRLQQNVSTTWSWVGDFGVPSDVTTGDGAVFKRGVVVEHAESAP